MSIAKTVVDCLQQCGIPYDVIGHVRTPSARDTVSTTHIPPERIAKAVVLSDGRHYVMAVVPANRYVSVKTLSKKLKRPLSLIPEERLPSMFGDCERGAIPPLGPSYGMETIVDDSLVGQPEIYFEAGDHEELIRVNGEQFLTLLRQARYGQFTH